MMMQLLSRGLGTQSMIKRVGMDIAKQVFQVDGVNEHENPAAAQALGSGQGAAVVCLAASL
jgi:hypothetical protein